MVQLQIRPAFRFGLDGLEQRVHRARARGFAGEFTPLVGEGDLGVGLLARFGHDLHRQQLVRIVVARLHVRNDGMEVLVVNVAFFVGQILEARKRLVEHFLAFELNAQLQQLGLEGVAP